MAMAASSARTGQTIYRKGEEKEVAPRAAVDEVESSPGLEVAGLGGVDGSRDAGAGRDEDELAREASAVSATGVSWENDRSAGVYDGTEPERRLCIDGALSQQLAGGRDRRMEALDGGVTGDRGSRTGALYSSRMADDRAASCGCVNSASRKAASCVPRSRRKAAVCRVKLCFFGNGGSERNAGESAARASR
jgi:hypothetical protein